MEPQDARSAFTRSRVFRGPHDENPYIPIRGWNHPFLDSMQFPRGHVRPPGFRGFLSSAVYRRRAEGPDEKAWARIRAMQCVLGRGVCFCRPSSRRTARFLQQISSYKRLLPLAVEDARRGPRKMPDQRIADEADFGGLLKMASFVLQKARPPSSQSCECFSNAVGEGFRVVDAQAEGEGLFRYPPALWYEKALIAGERVGFCRQRSNMRRLSRVRPIRMMSCGRVR